MSQASLQIPKSSVKRIMKLNEDVNAISQVSEKHAEIAEKSHKNNVIVTVIVTVVVCARRMRLLRCAKSL